MLWSSRFQSESAQPASRIEYQAVGRMAVGRCGTRGTHTHTAELSTVAEEESRNIQAAIILHQKKADQKSTKPNAHNPRSRKSALRL